MSPFLRVSRFYESRQFLQVLTTIMGFHAIFIEFNMSYKIHVNNYALQSWGSTFGLRISRNFASEVFRVTDHESDIYFDLRGTKIYLLQLIICDHKTLKKYISFFLLINSKARTAMGLLKKVCSKKSWDS